MALTINKNLMSINHTALRRSKADIKYIVVHYVGALGDAKANTDYYRSTSVGASADFWIGHSGDVWQGNDYYNFYSWHCGGGRQSAGGGKYYGICKNSNSVGIEMCVKKKSTCTMNATDRDWYFTDQTIASAAQLVAELMRELDIDIDHVIRHYDVNGKICPNPFVYDNGSVTWAGFKKMVAEYFSGDAPADPLPITKIMSGIPATKEEFIESAGTIATALQAETGILASVVTAQACLETGFGLGSDAKVLVEVNNLLGMKSDLINSTWSEWSVWSGKSITKRTPEYYGGKLTYINDSFRAYTDYENCLRDYEMFLLHVRNNKGLKYARIAGMTDAKQVIHAIRIGTGTDAIPEGYCTDPNYETKVLRLIDQYDLHQYNLPTSTKQEVKRAEVPAAQKAPENARMRLVAACREMNAEMIKSQQTGAKWGYYNSSTSATFAKAIASGNHRANCATTANWALKMIGAIPEGATGFYGEKNGEIKYKSARIKEALLACADVISVGGKKTVNTAIHDGTIIAGDIVTYYDIRHTNTYLGDGKWLDSGHAYANGQGDGAGWQTWIGDTYYGAQKVGCVIRLKVEETAPEPEPSVRYRVQVGAYRLKDNAVNQANKVKQKGFACIVKQYGQYWVAQAGVFSVKANADALVKRLQAAGFNAGIETM